jgi:hypothetical protein
MNFFLLRIGFTKSQTNTNIYVWWVGAPFLFIGLYVDDTILMNNHLALLAYTKELLSKEFETNSGEIPYCLSIQVKQNRKFKKIYLSREKYFNDILA